MQYEDIIKLVREVSQAGLAHFEYTEGNIHIVMGCKDMEPKEQHIEEHLAKKDAAPAAGPVSRKEAAEIPEETQKETPQKAEEARGSLVKSPLVGTFYAAPAEDAAPYVKVGDHVTKGQCIGIVEAMKLMNEIESDYTGTVTAILAENGEPVEYGQPLISVEVEG